MLKTCSIDKCPTKSRARGLCKKHYTRVMRHGDAGVVINNHGEGETPEARFWSRVDKDGPIHPTNASLGRCWEWQASGSRYGQVSVNGTLSRAHRAAWFYVKGAMPTLFLLHSCDNGLCVNPNHLREGTAQDNYNDAVSRGRHTHGERIWSSKLTDEHVRAIRAGLDEICRESRHSARSRR